MVLFLTCVAAALGISALCSLLEATLLSFTPSQVASLTTRHPRVAGIWQSFKTNIEKPIAVILIVNTAAHTIGATLAGAQFEVVFGEQWLVAFSLLFTYLMLQFTEILPKTLGVRYNSLFAPVVAGPLYAMVKALSPVLWFIHLVNRPFERRREAEDTTLEEIAALAATARLARAIDTHQERMISAATRLDEMRVRQALTPRTEVAWLKLGEPVEHVLHVVQHSPYTRLPLCENDIDHVLGFVHIKDLFQHLDLVPGRFDIKPATDTGSEGAPHVVAIPGSGLHVIGSGNLDLMKIRRDVLFFPEHLPVLEAMRRFQDARQHLAIIVDEYGSTLGILTLEDVLEEMVGDIRDEFDVPAPQLFVKQGKAYRVSGRLPLHELLLHFPALDLDTEDVDTVGGYVAKAFGRIPRAGESFALGPYTIRVTAATPRRVDEVLLEPQPQPGDAR